MASKRPATSDLAEPADKKSKARDSADALPGTSSDASLSSYHTTPSQSMDVSQNVVPTLADMPPKSTPGGILNMMIRHISSPVPLHDPVEVLVLSVNYANYFESLYSDLVNAIYPDSTDAMVNIITEEQFVIVCRYLLKGRVDTVFSSVSGKRPPRRIALAKDFEVPKALADLINGVGAITILNGAFLIIPHPEPAHVDNAMNLDARVSYAMLQGFARLVNAARVRGIINVGYLTNVSNGTAWWILSARDSAHPDVVANDNSNVLIRAAFNEWTPTDAFYSAIVQNQFDGQLADVLPDKWTTDPFRGTSAIRTAFNVGA